MIWLTGGPGGSSMIALINENGPCTVNSDLSTKNNAYSWNKQANVIWLDQPIGVGYSYGAPEDADFNGTNVGKNLYWFLQGFIEKHPEFDNHEFFLTGKSYGGYYVPAGVRYITEQNKLGSKQPGSKKSTCRASRLAMAGSTQWFRYELWVETCAHCSPLWN